MRFSLDTFWGAARHMADTVVNRLPALIVAVIVFCLFYISSVFVASVIKRTVSRQRLNLGVVFARLASGGIFLIGFLVSFSIVAPSFQAGDLIKILGIGGVAIGFAFQNILQNFLAGLLLLWTEPFRVGDEIKLDAFEGQVEEIQTRATIIKTYDERRVVIPNADLFTRSVIVNTALNTRRWEYDLTVARSRDLTKIRSLIVNTVRGVPGVLSDPTPETLVTDLNPDAVKLRVLWWTQGTRQHDMLASYDRVLTAVIQSLGRLDREKSEEAA
jgi:small-conductance mechanosensitive channel